MLWSISLECVKAMGWRKTTRALHVLSGHAVASPSYVTEVVWYGGLRVEFLAYLGSYFAVKWFDRVLEESLVGGISMVEDQSLLLQIYTFWSKTLITNEGHICGKNK